MNLRRLRALFRRHKFDADMRAEMEAHLEEQTQRNLAAGMSATDARAAAHRQFGGVTQVQERCRDERRHGWAWLEQFFQDLHYAIRLMASRPWFSAAIVTTLALGIGINSTGFTLVHAVLFKPLPIPGGERLVFVERVEQSSTNPTRRRLGVSLPEFREFRSETRVFAALEAVSAQSAVLSENSIPPERLRAARVSAGLFDMLRATPMPGRDFTAVDELPGAEPVVLISHATWQNRYAGAADVVGRSVRVDGVPATIIGVMPEGFRFPQDEHLWMPLVSTAALEDRTHRRLQLFGLLRPGASVTTAQADLEVIAARQAEAFPDTDRNLGVSVLPFKERSNDKAVRAAFVALLGAVGFVLLIACANVANLMLSRSLMRAREFAVRATLGASRGRLVRQMLVESVLLSALGGALGLGMAAGGVHVFEVATRDTGRPYWIQFELDYVSFGYVAFISILSGLLFGLVPALRASRLNLDTALKDDTRTATGRRHGRLTGALVVLQFALTVVLLAGAGVMLRSFLAARALNPDVAADEILIAQLRLPSAAGERYEDATNRQQFLDRVLADLQALPGVAQAVEATNFPGLGLTVRPIEIEGQPEPTPGEPPPRASQIAHSPDYFDATGVALLSGRGFLNTDGEPGREAAVVTRRFADLFWPNGTALGKRFRFVAPEPVGPWITVVGVCADVVQSVEPGGPPAPLVYTPLRQELPSAVTLLVRTASDPVALAAPMRAVVQALDPDLPVSGMRTLRAALDREFWALRVFGTLFGVLASIALLMASVGLYAVVAQAAAQCTREIGIRLALGAGVHRIVRLVLARGLYQLGLGVALGSLGGFATTHLLATAGFTVGDTSPIDPWIFASIVLLLTGVGAVACWAPTRRALRVNPVDVLRAE